MVFENLSYAYVVAFVITVSKTVLVMFISFLFYLPR
jgi:hypothetical protein